MDITIQARRVTLPVAAKEALQDRLHAALDRFDSLIRRGVMALEDINGPRGGRDKQCRLLLSTSFGGEVIIEERADQLQTAAMRAIDRAAATVRRLVGKRQTWRHGAS